MTIVIWWIKYDAREKSWNVCFWCSYQPSLNYKDRLKGLARDKNASLFVWIISDEEKKFDNFDIRGLYYKTFYSRNLRISVIS
jgi:hypothetical protein